MEFNLSRLDSNNHLYNTPRSNYTFFTDLGNQMQDESWRGRSISGVESFRHYLDTKEEIQREIEKERIREEILTEELARKRVLEAEVRRELMSEMRYSPPIMFRSPNGGGYSPSIMFRSPISHDDAPRGKSFGPVSENYGVIKYDPRPVTEIGGFEAAPCQATDLEKSNGLVKSKPPSCVVAGSSRSKHESCEIGLGVGPSSIKNSRKRVSVKNKGGMKQQKFPFWCEMCQVGASFEIVMDQHKKGKKHLKNLKTKKQDGKRKFKKVRRN